MSVYILGEQPSIFVASCTDYCQFQSSVLYLGTDYIARVGGHLCRDALVHAAPTRRQVI